MTTRAAVVDNVDRRVKAAARPAASSSADDQGERDEALKRLDPALQERYRQWRSRTDDILVVPAVEGFPQIDGDDPEATLTAARGLARSSAEAARRDAT